MYNVSEAYKEAMLSNYQRCLISGTVGGVNFTTDDVLANSVDVKWQCANNNSFAFGGVFATQLQIVFTWNILGRGNWLGKKIELRYTQILDDDTTETIPIGEFFIDSVSYTDNGVSVSAYDKMLAFDLDASSFQTSGFLYDILLKVCTDCKVVLGNTKAQIESMPNGTKIVGFSLSSEISTYRDILHHIAMFLCGFAIIGRDGKLYIKQFSNTPVATLTTEHRITGSKYADYNVHYTEIQYTDINKENTIVSKASEYNNGEIMSFGANPFIQNLVDVAKNEVLTNWLYYATQLQYVPFSSVLVGNPAFDIGDCLEFTGGMAGTSMLVALTSVAWKFGGGYSAEGADMPTSNVGYASTGGASSYSSTVNDWKLYTYKNSSEISIETMQEAVEISRISVTNNGTTNVEVTTQMNLESDGLTDLEFFYELDGEPIESEYLTHHISETGEYIITLNRSVLLQTNGAHRISLYAMSNGASITVPSSALETIVKGVKLTAIEGWDGNVEISERITISRRFNTIVPNADTVVDISFRGQVQSTVTETITIERKFSTETPNTDDFTIFRDAEEFYLTTEAGQRLNTEAGENIVTG